MGGSGGNDSSGETQGVSEEATDLKEENVLQAKATI